MYVQLAQRRCLIVVFYEVIVISRFQSYVTFIGRGLDIGSKDAGSIPVTVSQPFAPRTGLFSIALTYLYFKTRNISRCVIINRQITQQLFYT